MSDSSYNAQLPGLDPLRAEGEALRWVGTMGVMGEGGGLPPSHAPHPAAPYLLGPPFAATSAGLTVVHRGDATHIEQQDELRCPSIHSLRT